MPATSRSSLFRHPRREALEATIKRHMDQAVGSRATHLFVFASVAAFLTGCAMAGWGILLREICLEAT
jgi:hypothetical protein